MKKFKIIIKGEEIKIGEEKYLKIKKAVMEGAKWIDLGEFGIYNTSFMQAIIPDTASLGEEEQLRIYEQGNEQVKAYLEDPNNKVIDKEEAKKRFTDLKKKMGWDY